MPAFLYTDQYEGCPKETGITAGNAHTPAVRDFLSQTTVVQSSGMAYVDDTTTLMPSPRHLVLARNAIAGAYVNVHYGVGASVLPAVTCFGFHFSIDNFPATTAIAFAGIGVAPADYAVTAASEITVGVNGSIRFGGTSSAAGLITAGSLHHCQIEYTKATRTARIWIDEVLVLTASASGMPIEPPPSMYVRVSSSTNTLSHSYTARFDNVWIHDTAVQGAVSAIRLPLAASVGTPSFVPQGGAATNLAAVNKADVSSTTYNESTATNNVGDLYSLDTSSIPAGSTILALAVKTMNRKAAPGARSLQSVVTNGTLTDKQPLPESAVNFSAKSTQIYSAALDATAWDLTKLTAMNVGYEVRA